jgi:hypothetical protein
MCAGHNLNNSRPFPVHQQVRKSSEQEFSSAPEIFQKATGMLRDKADSAYYLLDEMVGSQ